MRRTGTRRLRHRFSVLAMRWVEVLWLCRCQYHNIATYRCYGCGSRPPRELRAMVAALPVHDTEQRADFAAAAATAAGTPTPVRT